MRLVAHLRHHVVGYLALFLVLGGVGHAALIAPDGTIKACVIPTTGATANTRIIDEADDCQAGQTPIAWNQTGPAGPAGQTGAAGPAGQAGPAGAPGLAADNASSVQLGKPEAGLATTPGKTRKKVKKIRVTARPVAGKKQSKVTISRRIFVTGLSGAAGPPLITYGNVSVPDPTGLAKTARVTCPESAPQQVSVVGEGIAGAFDAKWQTTSGAYEEDGVSTAWVTVTARLGPGDQTLPDGSTVPEFPGNLNAYVFEITVECVS